MVSKQRNMGKTRMGPTGNDRKKREKKEESVKSNERTKNRKVKVKAWEKSGTERTEVSVKNLTSTLQE
jgi:L-2-hydroxyglutarate oxidase LhgO